MYNIYAMHSQKCLDTSNDVNPDTGLPGPSRLLFNRPIRGLLPQMHREPINMNTNDAQYKALNAHQNTYVKNNDAHKVLLFFSI